MKSSQSVIFMDKMLQVYCKSASASSDAAGETQHGAHADTLSAVWVHEDGGSSEGALICAQIGSF